MRTLVGNVQADGAAAAAPAHVFNRSDVFVLIVFAETCFHRCRIH